MTQSPHPRLPMLTKEQGVAMAREKGVDFVQKWIAERERAIELEKTDPFRYGYEIRPGWDDARRLEAAGCTDLLILGGNRASKTDYAAKRVNEILANKEGARAWCLHSSDASSRSMQQPVIYKYLPPEWRAAGKQGSVTNVSYTQKNGFSENTFVLPNTAQCWFMNYMQDPKVIEGGELDVIWCDELVPYDWLETLRFRLVTRRGLLIVTFTPVTGYSLVVKDYVAGAKIVQSRPSSLLPDTANVPGCPRGHMPYILDPCLGGGNRRVISFFTEDNPYSPFDRLAAELKGKPGGTVKMRAYGWAEKLDGNVFAKFGDVNIVKPAAIPLAKDCTNYMVVDPGGAKNWFITWLRVDKFGRIFVHREYPTPDMGEWTLPSEKPDGKPGPAQKADAGKGITGYKRLILDLEDGEEITERLIDPRAGAAAVPGIDEGTTIIDLMAQEQVDRDGKVTGPAMSFIPAPATRTMQETGMDDGVSLVNDWLDYDEQKPVTILNAPRLYVSERCPNTIYALREWTGLDGQKGASKDPVDCLKYAAKRGLEYVAPGDLVVTGGFRQ